MACAVVIAGVAGRFLASGGLWLDEALSVNIAKLPLAQLPGALVQDGSPPLYYLVLHYWMLLFGQGDFAVRALSGVISTATLPFLWAAGKRAGGPTDGVGSSPARGQLPWAIYYGTDTRMYSLMALEAILWYLAVRRALELPSRRRLDRPWGRDRGFDVHPLLGPLPGRRRRGLAARAGVGGAPVRRARSGARPTSTGPARLPRRGRQVARRP